VIPTGEELVQSDPGPGEVIETNGLTVSRLVERWGGEARYRDVVTDDEDALSAAIEADLDADVVVTTGGPRLASATCSRRSSILSGRYLSTASP